MVEHIQWPERTCVHPEAALSGSIRYTVERDALSALFKRDWGFAITNFVEGLTLEELGAGLHIAGLIRLYLCPACYALLPSQQAKAKPVSEDRPEPDELQEALERVENGEALYYCSGCGEFKEEEDLVPLRECPHCAEVFDGNEGRNCPSCNRPFTRRLEGDACSECLDPDALPEPATAELIRGMQTKS